MIVSGPIVWQTALTLPGVAGGAQQDVPAGVLPPVVYDGNALRMICRLTSMKLTAGAATSVGLELIDTTSGLIVYDERTPIPAVLNVPFTIVCETPPFKTFGDGTLLVPGTTYSFKLTYGLTGAANTLVATYGSYFRGHAAIYEDNP